MGLFDAVKGAVGGALSDQWRDIFTAGRPGRRNFRSLDRYLAAMAEPQNRITGEE